MKISIIIPMYNESAVIEQTARTLSQYMANRFSDYEILFSDDGSTDGCGNIVRNLHLPCVRVVGYSQNHGKGCAVRTAMLEADGDILLFTDADLAYGTEVIAKGVETMVAQEKVDILLGSRNLDANGYGNYTRMRRWMSKIYLRVLCLVGGFRLSDSQCGFKLFRRSAAKAVFSRMTVNGFAFDFEMILRAQSMGFRLSEMPVCILHHRESKIHMVRDSIRMLRDLRRIRKQIKKEEKQQKRT